MGGIKWSSELSVGVPEIDDQHKELISIANTLVYAVTNKADRTEVDTIIKNLRSYTVVHFKAEEQLMHDNAYPKLGPHEIEHARLKADVKQFQRDLYKSKPPTPTKILMFIRGWLLEHILNYDREFSRFLQEKDTKARVVEVK